MPSGTFDQLTGKPCMLYSPQCSQSIAEPRGWRFPCVLNPIAETPLSNLDLIFFVEAHLCVWGLGEVVVVNQFDVIESHLLPGNLSAQAADLVALF